MIKIDDVSMLFSTRKNDIHALDGVSLDIADGEFISLLGPSGCGKSTLLNICAGLIRPTKGNVNVNGFDVRSPQTEIGIVFQKPVLVDWRTILGNVMLQVEMRGLNSKDYMNKADELLSSVGLQDFRNSMPYELSGGMRQRTSFCRALVHDPPVVFMDEPLGALDAMTRERLRLDLESLWSKTKKTFIFVTHDILEAIQLSTTVVVMTPRPGKVNRVIKIDLDRPRDMNVRQSKKFLSYVREITTIFEKYEVI